jgi:UDP-N-acetylglucosamine 2-epimerase (non-hydrolysing)
MAGARRILIPMGTRPEIVKLAPVIRALRGRGAETRLVLTGQHYDPALSDVFLQEFGLAPDDRWHLSGDEAERVGAMLTAAYREVATSTPDLVLLLGDTHTVSLFSLAARRHRVPVAHLEAGLRSFNETSLEEVNRKVAGVCSSLHLAPTDLAARFLRAEGVDERRIKVVGNPICDVLLDMGARPRPTSERAGVVVTAHRATNVDDPARLAQLVELVEGLAARVGPVTFPLHPRTRDRLDAGGFFDRLEAAPGVRLTDAVAYTEMIELLGACRVVVTDSGGLQEEASWLGVPAVVIRRSTPRWEGVALGTTVLTGLDARRALDAAELLATPSEQERVAAVPCPYGDGHTGERVADLLSDPDTWDLLRLDEPDYVDQPPPR